MKIRKRRLQLHHELNGTEKRLPIQYLFDEGLAQLRVEQVHDDRLTFKLQQFSKGPRLLFCSTESDKPYVRIKYVDRILPETITVSKAYIAEEDWPVVEKFLDRQ